MHDREHCATIQLSVPLKKLSWRDQSQLTADPIRRDESTTPTPAADLRSGDAAP